MRRPKIPYIKGRDQFQVNVAGESFYPDAFAALCGARTRDGIAFPARAQLILDDGNVHDKNAVKVEVDGHQVGHLPREAAKAFRRSVRYGELAEHEVFECAALINGGWNRGGGDAGNFGVKLDLALFDD
jgi:hypothetical protein